MVQCKYCEYITTADEYGLVDAPVHLWQSHGITLIEDEIVEDHLYFVRKPI